MSRESVVGQLYFFLLHPFGSYYTLAAPLDLHRHTSATRHEQCPGSTRARKLITVGEIHRKIVDVGRITRRAADIWFGCLFLGSDRTQHLDSRRTSELRAAQSLHEISPPHLSAKFQPLELAIHGAPRRPRPFSSPDLS